MERFFWVRPGLTLLVLVGVSFATYIITGTAEPFSTFSRHDLLWAVVVPTATITAWLFWAAKTAEQVVRGKLSRWWVLGLLLGSLGVPPLCLFCVMEYALDMETSDCYDCPRAIEDAGLSAPPTEP